MDSAKLLVIDHLPERAEEINSLLRNSGITIHVLFAATSIKAEKLIASDRPCLIIHNASAIKNAPVQSILKLAAQHGIAVAVRCSPEAPESLLEALGFGSCIAVNENDDGQLVDVVRRQVQSGRSTLDQSDAQQKMEELGHRYELLLDSARDSIAYLHEGLHIYANRAYLESMQVKSFEELEGHSLLELMRGDEMDLKKLFRDMNRGKFPKKPVPVTVTNPSGTTFEGELTFSAARFGGEDCIQMIMQQRDTHAALRMEVERLRQTDQLTQMMNRQTFREYLVDFVGGDETGHGTSAVFYIEPDGIHELQEDLGVAELDSYIAELAEVIRGCIDADDIAARISDHGFAVLAQRGDKGSIQDIGQCIVRSFNNHSVELERKTLPASCSVGMVAMGSLTRDADEVLANARAGFAEAAQKGNCLVRYKPPLTAVADGEQDKQWVERISFALNNHELYSIQQSIVNLDGELEGLFESRTFMREEDGDLRPEEFLPVAERNDLASTIDRHVIPGLLNTISGSGDRHIINLSGNSVLDFSFPSWFRHQLEAQDVQGTQIILQISAHAAELDLKSTRRLIEELKPRGCTFSLSSFDDQRITIRLLQQLDVSLVKLRTGLTQGLANNSSHQEVIRNVVRETESAGVEVIADEIQDASDLAVLWQCGVKLVAGDFLKEAPQVVGQ